LRRAVSSSAGFVSVLSGSAAKVEAIVVVRTSQVKSRLPTAEVCMTHLSLEVEDEKPGSKLQRASN
jgi:hypothetical protein